MFFLLSIYFSLLIVYRLDAGRLYVSESLGQNPRLTAEQRCDGKHPICTRCATDGRELDCEYTESLDPTRTELLQNYLERLTQQADALKQKHAERGV